MNATMTTMEPEKLMDDSGLRNDLIVLDVRTPQEFRESHIKGSINIPLADLPPRIASTGSCPASSITFSTGNCATSAVMPSIEVIGRTATDSPLPLEKGSSTTGHCHTSS